MKDEFIKFLKEHHALQEFKKDIYPTTMDDLDTQFKDGGARFVLEDGCLFWYKSAESDADYKTLNTEWVQFCNDLLKQKYPNDFCRCSGENCLVKEKCGRYHARVEALNLGIDYGCYLETMDCIATNASLFVAVEVEVSV